MKVTVKDYLNVRVGKPSVNAPTYQYLAPGSEIEVDGIRYKGDLYENIDDWLKDEAGNYYWSGGFYDSGKRIYPWWIEDFGIDNAWNVSKGENVNVILLDSGLADEMDLSFSPTKYSVLGDEGSDSSGHGTLMASIIAGKGNKIHGIAPKATIISIKIASNDQLNVDNLILGITKAKELANQQGKFVLNCSLTVTNPSTTDLQKIKVSFEDLLMNKNITVCAAVGNEFQRNPQARPLPASLKEILSVEAFMKDNNGKYDRLSSSNYWPEISLSAPGDFPIDGFIKDFSKIPTQGSSHACAFSAGLAALFLSNGTNNVNSLRQWILKSISQSTSLAYNSNLVSNRIDKNNFINTFFNKT